MKKEDIIVPLILLFIISVGSYWLGKSVRRESKAPLQYWARFEDGAVVKVDNIVVFPIQKSEDIAGMWPEYFMVTTVTISGNDFEMYSRPFLLCDDLNLAGEHFDRMVYYVPEP